MERSKHEAKNHAPYNNSLHETRFKVLFFLYRMAGFPLKVKSASRLIAVYNAILIVCFYIAIFLTYVDTFVHRHQLAFFMKKLRVALGMQMCVCSHFSAR
jgi:hypothetical protein